MDYKWRMNLIISQPLVHKTYNEGERTIRNTNIDGIGLIDNSLDLDTEDGDYNSSIRKSRHSNCLNIKKLVI